MAKDDRLSIEVKPVSKKDLFKVREMALNVWKEAYKVSGEEFFDIFNLEYIDFNLGGPHESDNTMLGAYLKDTLVGCIGFIVTTVMIKGKKYKVANSSWYTSDRLARDKIMEEANVNAIVHDLTEQDARIDSPKNMPISYALATYGGGVYCFEKNIDSVIGYYEENHAGYKAFLRAADSAGDHVKNYNIKFTYPIAIVDGIHNAKQFIRPHKNSVKIIEYKNTYLEDSLRLLNKYGEKLELATFWSHEELSWQLDYKNVSETILYQDAGKIRGIINYLIINSISNEGVDKFAVIDNIHMDYLDEAEKKYFLLYFLNIIKEKGIIGAVYWHQNCFDENILLQVGFDMEKRNHYQCFHNFAVKEIYLDGVHDTYVRFR